MNISPKIDARQQYEQEGEGGGGQRHSKQQHRIIKRIRQACTHCRQRKIRCSGDRPCKLCAKLSQNCVYHTNENGERPRPRISIADQYDTLPSRVSMIESKLTQLICYVQESMPEASASDAPANQSPIPSDLFAMDFDGCQSDTTSCDRGRGGMQVEELWTKVPPKHVLQTAADVYFLHCQNQPYSYFHKDTFRRKLAEGSLPEYLIFAFLATALRFSTDPYYQNMQAAAADAYASASWKAIVSHQLTQEDGMNLHIVQAANLLAIIDFTASRVHLAWMKIGLAVRIAQDLRLMYEPDANVKMSLIEQEEQRRVFWSVYVLDKLVSCGKARPPALLNADCKVLLPCDELAFRRGTWQKSQTIDSLLNENAMLAEQPSDFGLVILMASHLGLCARYSLHECGTDDEYPPWDSRSDFARITSSLMCFESYADFSKGALAARVSREFMVNGIVDNEQTGHIIFARALFHLSHCLLNHPFLLRKKIEKFSRNAPGSFLSTVFQTCVKHAGMLSSLVKEARDSNCLVETSFYSYCITVSSTIHCLYLNSPDEIVCRTSSDNLQVNFELLRSLSRYWNHAALMLTALTKFQAKAAEYSNLIAIKTPIDKNLSPTETEDLWSLVDYGLMSKAAVPAVMYSQVPMTEWSSSTWLDAGDGSELNAFGSEEFGVIGSNFSEHVMSSGSNFDISAEM